MFTVKAIGSTFIHNAYLSFFQLKHICRKVLAQFLHHTLGTN